MSNAWFIAVPPAAARDTTLSAVDLRVLLAVAGHDRLGRNGRGCFAAQGTLAGDAQCDISSVKRSLKHLRQQGHLTSEKNPKDGRQYIWRVVYTNMPVEIGRMAAPYLSDDRAQNDTKVGLKVSENSFEKQGPIPPKYNNKHIVLNAEENSEESAPNSFHETGASNFTDNFELENVGGRLAQMERALKADSAEVDADDWSEELRSIVEDKDLPFFHPNRGRAQRLLDHLEYYYEMDEKVPASEGGYNG